MINRPRVKAQLVVRRTEKAGAMLTRVRVFSADSYGVRTTPVYTWHASTSVDTLKTPTLAAMPLAGHTEILHTLMGMGSNTLVAAVHYPDKATGISRKGL